MDESGESYEPILPDELDLPKKKPSIPPPLPRLWKTPAEELPAEELESAKPKKVPPVVEPTPKPRSARPKGAPKKKAEPEFDDGTGAVKLEETPVLDTVEARQRARWLVGGLLASIGAVFLFLVIGAFRGGENAEIHDGEPPDLRTVSDTKSSGEVEARNLLDNAKHSDKLGRTDAALNLLNKVTKTYPSTAAAREALHAIDRHRANKPLFADDLPQQASGPKKPADGGQALATGPTPPSTNPTPNSTTSDRAETPRPPDQSAKNSPLPSNSTPTSTPTVSIRPLPIGYRPNFEVPIHPSGWPSRIFADKDGAELVLIPGTAFNMGRQDGEPQEAPVHRVALSTYYIDLHEVTVKQYGIFLKASGRPLDLLRKSIPKGAEIAAYENYPIVNVSSAEAKAFCDWARRTLPTEAQWELAARSSEDRVSYWNGELPRKDPAKGPRVMEPVMSLPSDYSPLGVFDLGANAWEWTSEFYDSQYYHQFRDIAVDPTGPKKNKGGLVTMTVKGGSKFGFLTWRDGLKAETRLPYLGFRGALSVEATPVPANSPNNPAGTSSSPGRSGGVQPF